MGTLHYIFCTFPPIHHELLSTLETKNNLLHTRKKGIENTPQRRNKNYTREEINKKKRMAKTDNRGRNACRGTVVTAMK